ncbi:LuxR C-terminal-related transcriptional regulator [Microbispora bryophytorum]|uniref:helix-turn-helix transcriptional regulator n=1 Tax=Microbispora bryophytorum TaxID=1460882 RepID=UPI0033EA94FC
MSTTRNAPSPADDPFGSLGLSPDQTALYTAMLRLHRTTLTELAEAVGRSAEDVLDALDGLVRLGAVNRRREELIARHPAATIGRLVAERLDRMARETRQIDEVLAAAGRLTHHYDAGLDWRSGRFSVEAVSGADELCESVIGLALQAPPAELVMAVPDRRTMARLADGYGAQWIQVTADGILSLRMVVALDAVSAPAMREVCARFSAAGAGLRALDAVPSWFFALGDGTAGLPAEWGVPPHEHSCNCFLVHAPVVVGALRALFDALWAQAAPISPRTNAQQVLRLAAHGLSDDAVARHLGVSVRTVRARFAEAMSELGAQSRFHAGVEAARRGWL